MSLLATDRAVRTCQIAALVVALSRLFSLGWYPLMDNTEARYAELARVMATTGDWLTPRFADGQPFWAKPPLSTWLSAAALKVFGANEFAARLPYWLLALAIAALTYQLACKTLGVRRAWLAVAALATVPLFIVASGAVMTDMALVLGTTLAMVGFWRRSERPWALAAFVGVALALLGKGPVGLVLIGLPIVGWLAWSRDLRPLLRLPWLVGIALVVTIAVPWYLAAERATPGFLDYFLVGEHYRRFVDPGWKGDLYGTAHDQPRGMIWLYAPLDCLPWSIVAALALRGRAEAVRRALGDPLLRYLLCWTVAPLIFFTVASNILYTYFLPALPAVAVLLSRTIRETVAIRTIVVSAAAATAALAIAVPVVSRLPGVEAKAFRSEKAMMKYLAPRTVGDVVYWSPGQPRYWNGTPNSAAFYSSGLARSVPDRAALDALPNRPRWIIVSGDVPSELSDLVADADVQRFGKRSVLTLH